MFTWWLYEIKRFLSLIIWANESNTFTVVKSGKNFDGAQNILLSYMMKLTRLVPSTKIMYHSFPR